MVGKRLYIQPHLRTQAEEMEETAERLRERAADQGAAEEIRRRLESAQDALLADHQALRVLQAEAAMNFAEAAQHRAAVVQLRAHVADLQVRGHQ